MNDKALSRAALELTQKIQLAIREVSRIGEDIRVIARMAR